MVGKKLLEVGSVDATELHAREALDRVAVDVVGQEHAVPERLAVVQHVEHVFLTV